MKKIYPYILSIGFLVFLVFPQIASILKIFPEKTGDENRELSEKPSIDYKHLDTYPNKYDAWYNDHFGLRSVGLKAYNDFSYFFLKRSPDPKSAILGKEGWLFQGRDIDIYKGTKRLTTDELERLEVEFKKRWEFLNNHNCKFIFVVIPTKKIIYPEYLPDGYFQYSKRTMTDQFIEMLKTKTKVDVIDLRPVILNAKKNHPVLYHKMDNHWNDYATFYAYKAITDHITTFADLGHIHSLEEYTPDTTTYYGGSIAKMLGVQDSLIDYRLKLKPKFKSGETRLPQKYSAPERFAYPGSYERRYTTENDSLPRLMMVNDSFGEYFHKFLPEHFSYSIFLFDSWEFKLHPKKIINEKPDVYVLATFEGFIPNILDNIHRDENKIPEPTANSQ